MKNFLTVISRATHNAGVLQVEALAQAGAILLMTEKVEDPSKSLMVFTGINNCKFRRQVVPGDQLMLEVELGNEKEFCHHER